MWRKEKIPKEKRKNSCNSFSQGFGQNHLKKGGFKFDLINVGSHVY